MRIYLKYKQVSGSIYFFLLILLAVALPISKFLISITQILLFVNWLVEGEFKIKLQRLINKKSLWIFFLFYSVVVFWFFKNNDTSRGLNELVYKLPFLQLPLIIGTSKNIAKRQLEILLALFVGSVVLTSILAAFSMFNGLDFHISDNVDVRDSALLIHHIRFSILVATAIIFMLYWMAREFLRNKKFILLLIPITWLFFSFFFLKSLTGLVICIITTVILLLWYLLKIQSRKLRIVILIFIIIIPVLTCTYIYNVVSDYYSVENIDLSKIDTYTKSGRLYEKSFTDKQTENGHYVMLYICRDELYREWNKRSNIDINSVNKFNQITWQTLIRYMSSKGLRKDSVGVSKLSDADILNVESGLPNYIYAEKASIYPRIYEVIWEIDTYLKFGFADGHSLVQRYIYLKASLDLIKEYFWTGVGTGDTRITFNEYYLHHNVGLSKNNQHESHNQFLRILLEFGIFGFIIMIFSSIYPVFIEKKWNSFYVLAIYVITFLSFFNEDALESMVGSMMVAYFISLFLFGVETFDEI